MGFTPQQVNEMGLWEFVAASSGYAKAHGVKSKPQGEGMSLQQMRDLGIDGV